MKEYLVSKDIQIKFNIADNLYPKYFAPHEYETEHLLELTKNEKFLELSKEIVETNKNNELLQKLFMKIFDKDFELTK